MRHCDLLFVGSDSFTVKLTTYESVWQKRVLRRRLAQHMDLVVNFTYTAILEPYGDKALVLITG